VTLNIVGFSIDDDATESQFAEWTAAGGAQRRVYDDVEVAGEQDTRIEFR